MTTPLSSMTARERARHALEGLSLGDALGERFFGHPHEVIARIEAKEIPPGPWRWTDDTQMALSIFEVLRSCGEIDQDALAKGFARRFELARGYGRGAQSLLSEIQRGAHWRPLSYGLFEGRGSYGNGAAMRVAPLGAYFAEDMERLVGEADRSAEVTHANPEARAGAVAVAVAAGIAWRQGAKGRLDPLALFDEVIVRTPKSVTLQRLEEARQIPFETHPRQVAQAVGSGQNISAQDTVPFVIWCAARHLDDYREAFWATVAGLGDRDTTCAMVGGIVAMSSGHIPKEWREEREDWELRLRCG